MMTSLRRPDTRIRALPAMCALLLLLPALLPAAAAQAAPDADAGATAPNVIRETVLPSTMPAQPEASRADIFNALPRFGAELFAGAARARQGSSEIGGQSPAPASAPVPATYVIGPGDALTLRVSTRGREQLTQEMTVTPDGLVFPQEIERLTAAGRTLESLRGELEARYARVFANPTVTLTVSAQRVIDVYVTGDAMRPGRYPLVGMATVLDALYAAGGPSEIGSYRRIRLTRVGCPEREVDLYDYLLTGSREFDALLNPGDTVFIPATGPEVGLTGEVRRPGRYELRGNATVSDAVAMAGGLTPQAYQVLNLWRTDDRRDWRLVSIATADDGAQGMGMAIHDGDLIVARGIRDAYGNTARILGAVMRPGYYPVERYPRVSALIEAAEGLAENAHVGRGTLSRLNAQLHAEVSSFDVARALAGDPDADLPLQANDIVTIYEQADVEPPAEVQITGAVREPGTYRWAENLRVTHLIARAGGLLPEAYTDRADLLRLTPDQTWQVMAVNLAGALDGAAQQDLPLLRGDRLQVRTREEVGLSGEVTVAGLVRQQGSYPRYDGMRVSDLLFAAGGPTPGAGPDIELTRGRFEGSPEPVRLALIGSPDDYRVEPDPVLLDDDSVTVTGRGEFKARADVVYLKGRVTAPGAYPVRSGPADKPYTVWDLLQDGGGIMADGNVAGIVVYRPRAAAIGQAQQEDLQRVLQSVNAEASQAAPVQVGSDQQAEAMSAAVSYRLQQAVTTPSGVSIVLPPRPVREEDWVSAIPIDGRNLVATEGAEDNLALEAGDTVVVPRLVNTVMVLGAVPRSGAVPYVQDSAAEYYLNESGGLREDAAANRMVVVHANGAVEPIRRNATLAPGDVVVVPTRHIVRSVRTESEWDLWLRTIVPLATIALIP